MKTGKGSLLARIPLWVGILGVISVVAVMVTLGPRVYQLTGDSFSGYGTVTLTAAFRAIAMASGVVSTGMLVFSVFVAPYGVNGLLSPLGYAKTRIGWKAALIFGCSCLVMTVLSTADLAGLSAWQILKSGSIVNLLDASEQPRAWLCAGIAGIVVAAITRSGMRVATMLFALSIQVGALMAPGLVTNNGQGPNHDFTTNATILHSASASIWVGVIVAAWPILARRDDPLHNMVTHRVRRISLMCIVLLGLSAIPMALIQLQMSTSYLFTVYGWLVLAQFVLWVLLIVAAAPRYARNVRAKWPLVSELVLLVATMTVAAITARIPSPNAIKPLHDSLIIYVGYRVPGPWTFTDLVTHWRFDQFWATIAVVGIASYLWLVRRYKRRQGSRWPVVRSVMWVSGWVLTFILTSSGISEWSGAQFSMHMVLHIGLNLFVAPLLVGGSPLLLMQQAYSDEGSLERPGPRQFVDTVMNSPLIHWLTNPVVALGIYTVTLFGLYFTPIFDAVIQYHWGHQLMNVHFLLTGLLFFWPMLGADPHIKRLSPLGRIGMLFALMPIHTLFGIIVMTRQTLLGDYFYRSIEVMSYSKMLSDQHLGGAIAWISGEVPILVAAVAILITWLRTAGDDTPADLLAELKASRQDPR